MIVGIPMDHFPGERRVALVPKSVADMSRLGMDVLIEQGAGVKAGFADATYEEQGARILSDRTQLFSSSDVIIKMHGFNEKSDADMADLASLKAGQITLGLLNPLVAYEALVMLAETGATTFALELLPRISRAQPMDALTSMATVAGYKAVLLAAGELGKMYPMMITAAGTITPARVLVIGAGVAGLQAIATSRRLGAVVQAYDVRPEVKEQVESLGAKFLELELDAKNTQASGAGGYAKAMDDDFYKRQQDMMNQAIAEIDVVISTAAVPGKKAPILITKEMVMGMRTGAIIVDLAAEGGGNCALTQPGKTIHTNGVSIIGPINLPSTVPYHSSHMYAKNVTAFLQQIVQNGRLDLNLEDQILRDTLLTHQGNIINQRVREVLGLPMLTTETDERNSY